MARDVKENIIIYGNNIDILMDMSNVLGVIPGRYGAFVLSSMGDTRPCRGRKGFFVLYSDEKNRKIAASNAGGAAVH